MPLDGMSNLADIFAKATPAAVQGTKGTEGKTYGLPYLSDAFGIGAAGSLPCFVAAQIAVESLATIEPYLAAVGLSSRRVRLKSEGSALAVALPAALGGTMLFHTA